MLRRDVLAWLAAMAAVPTMGQAAADGEPGLQLGAAQPFDPEQIVNRARDLATKPYQERKRVPQAWLDLSYDQYRAIWFDTRNALWENTDAPLRLDVFPPGLYFPHPIALSVVEDGQSRPVLFDMNVFDKTDQVPELPVDQIIGYSGLRLRAELETPGIYQEFAVFQGASYFRAIDTGGIYGISARGLAINTAEPSGEEFPDFEAFWVERPAPGQRQFTVHALLNGPSCSGAYSIIVRPGSPLTMEVSARLFARTEMRHIGMGALTSMFMFDETIRDRFSDFRPAVHDSDGLLIHNGGGEILWRPLANPRQLQVSGFLDRGPKGFGLMQRERAFRDFADLEALYHRRPGLWIEPGEDWGPGSVTLVEIPTDREIYDNIVAYWRPAGVIAAGEERQFSYRMSWGANPEPPSTLLPVLNTRMGGRPEGGQIVAIDFGPGERLPDDLSDVTQLIRTSAGEVSGGVLQRNPETGGPRLAFTFRAGDATLAEFRVQLRLPDGPLSEVWLYRWTA